MSSVVTLGGGWCFSFYSALAVLKDIKGQESKPKVYLYILNNSDNSEVNEKAPIMWRDYDDIKNRKLERLIISPQSKNVIRL